MGDAIDTVRDARITLERTPGAVRALLAGVPETAVTRRYAPQSFSPYHVVGHLIENERNNWIPRIRHLLEHGESVVFGTIDHTATIEPEGGEPVGALIDRFERLRRAGLEDLDDLGLDDAALVRCGAHPAFGAVTLAQLVSTWAAHDLHHLAQLCKGLAGRYAEPVGPWRAYLGILAPPARS